MKIATKIEKNALEYHGEFFCKKLGVGRYNKYDDSVMFPLIVYSTGAMSIPYGTTSERPISGDLPMIRFNTEFRSLEIYHPDSNAWGVMNAQPSSMRPNAIEKIDLGNGNVTYVGGLKPVAPTGMYAIDIQSKRDSNDFVAGDYSICVGSNLQQGIGGVSIGNNYKAQYYRAVCIGNGVQGQTLDSTGINIGSNNLVSGFARTVFIGNDINVNSPSGSSNAIAIGTAEGLNREFLQVGSGPSRIIKYLNGDKNIIFPANDMDAFDDNDLDDGQYTFGISPTEQSFVIKSKINDVITGCKLQLVPYDAYCETEEYARFVDGNYLVGDMSEFFNHDNYSIEICGIYHAGTLLGGDDFTVGGNNGTYTSPSDNGGYLIFGTSYCIFACNDDPFYDPSTEIGETAEIFIGYRLESYMDVNGGSNSYYSTYMSTGIPASGLFTDIRNEITITRSGDTLSITVPNGTDEYTFSVTEPELFVDGEGDNVAFAQFAGKAGVFLEGNSQNGNMFTIANTDFTGCKLYVDGEYVYEFPVKGYIDDGYKTTVPAITGYPVSGSNIGENWNYSIHGVNFDETIKNIDILNKKNYFSPKSNGDLINVKVDLIDQNNFADDDVTYLRRMNFSFKFDDGIKSTTDDIILLYEENLSVSGDSAIISYNPTLEQAKFSYSNNVEHLHIPRELFFKNRYCNLSYDVLTWPGYSSANLTAYFAFYPSNPSDPSEKFSLACLVDDIDEDSAYFPNLYIASSPNVPPGYINASSYANIENIYYVTNPEYNILDPLFIEQIGEKTYKYNNVNAGYSLTLSYSGNNMIKEYSKYPMWYTTV